MFGRRSLLPLLTLLALLLSACGGTSSSGTSTNVRASAVSLMIRLTVARWNTWVIVMPPPLW